MTFAGGKRSRYGFARSAKTLSPKISIKYTITATNGSKSVMVAGGETNTRALTFAWRAAAYREHIDRALFWSRHLSPRGGHLTSESHAGHGGGNTWGHGGSMYWMTSLLTCDDFGSSQLSKRQLPFVGKSLLNDSISTGNVHTQYDHRCCLLIESLHYFDNAVSGVLGLTVIACVL